MSILFYRRPDYTSPSRVPINASECQRIVESTGRSAHAIPEGLSFDNVMQNKALPPCSLNDFMDYLIYIEHNAENLQFYLWYVDYERRWNELPAKDQALSPTWQPDPGEVPNLREKDRKTIAKASINPPLQINFDKDVSEEFSGKGIKSDAVSFMTASNKGSILTAAEVNSQAGLKWQPFTIQPHRDECDQILRHYVANDSPRELNLSHKDRTHILRALQHTTHPSAFLPAFEIANATLRGQAHPNFIRWSICNGNKPRIIVVRSLGVNGIVAGFAIATVLTLSRVSRWWRILAFLFWLIGFSTIIAAYKGLCLILHTGHSRTLRPWELADDISIHSEAEIPRCDSTASGTASRDMDLAYKVASSSDMDAKDEEAPLRFDRTSMNPLGPKNKWEQERSAQAYERRSLLRKVFEKSVWTQDETLRMLQDKIVIGANVWSLIISLPLTVVFVALPSGNLF